MLRHDKAIAHPIRQKDHLKSVPDYLMPLSMRGVSNVRTKNNKRGKKRKVAGTTSGSQEQRVAQSKKKNPLYNFDGAEGGAGDGDAGGADGGDADGGDGAGEGEGASHGGSDGAGMSGRKEWKMRHKKGTFNPKAAKKNEHRTPGSFIKSKNYK